MKTIRFIEDTFLTVKPGNVTDFSSDQKIFIPSNTIKKVGKVINRNQYSRLTIDVISVINCNIWYCPQTNIEVVK
jgi:hypothetical protein